MIRFVDIREAEIEGHRFAFWCTVNNEWITLGGYQAWDNWSDFRTSFVLEYGPDVERYQRYVSLAPGWTVRPWDRGSDANTDLKFPKETSE